MLTDNPRSLWAEADAAHKKLYGADVEKYRETAAYYFRQLLWELDAALKKLEEAKQP